MAFPVTIQWTNTAVASLKQLPVKVRKGIVSKVKKLATNDPRIAHKPLIGPLAGIFTLKFSRYRVLYVVDEKHLPSGVVQMHLTVRVLLTGIRKEYDKKDIYEVARKLIKLGVIKMEDK